jgi:PAS domain S-box-containing protein
MSAPTQTPVLSELIHESPRTLVFRCRRPDTGAPVVVKRLHPEARSAAAERRLRWEYELLARLDLPGVIKAVALEEDGDGPSLVVEDIGGEDLGRLLERCRLSPLQFLNLASGLAEAVAGLHRSGVVHGEINPGHIIYNPETGHFRVIGLGSAGTRVRRPGDLKPHASPDASMAYTSPEQTGRLSRAVDHRTDFYSLGATFYTLLTGTPPFQADDALGMAHCHIASRPVPPDRRDPTIAKPISEMVMKLLEKAPDERYLSGEGLKADIDRCANRLRDQGRIEPFPLGTLDVPRMLSIPETLYGREQDVAALLAAFERVAAQGQPELVLVSGYSGIGKSSVVNAAHRELASQRVFFAVGKFDRDKQDTAYATLAEALQALVRQLLGKSEAEIGAWRDAIQEAVGPNGRLITEMVPDLVTLLGEQPPVPDVPPHDEQSRFNTVFRRFLGLFARPEKPLVLFLDDMQWIDAATQQLLEHLLVNPAVEHILFVGAYRDNEVGPSHPLTQALHSMEQARAAVHTIGLGPLSVGDVTCLTAETFRCGPVRAEPLAKLVYDKTGGNPFFAIQFLTELADEGLITFDGRTVRWWWDLDRIKDKGFTDNVADLMVGRLTRLPAATQETVKQLALMGRQTALATLASVRGDTEEDVEGRLATAIEAGLVLRWDDAVAFLHDHVQETAYALVPEGDRPAAHLNIGRQLLAQTAPEDLDPILFEVVSHLNRGSRLITDAAELARLAQLNMAAGKAARAAVAFATACNCFSAAASLLPEEAWTTGYDDTFALYRDWAEAACLRGEFEETERLIAILLERARDELDKAIAYAVRLELLSSSGRFDDAVAAGIEALALLGEEIPDDENLAEAIDAETEAVRHCLHGVDIADLAAAPEATDRRARALLQLLTGVGGPAYIGSRPQVYPLVALKHVRHVLTSGITRDASHALSGYANLLVTLFGDPRSAYQFSEVALSLGERFGDLASIGSLHYLHGNHIHFWSRPLATGLPILERGFRLCQDAGNLIFANYIAYSILWQAVERGDSLDDVLGFSREYATFAHSTKNESIYHSILLEQQFAKCLMGETDGLSSFSDADVDELFSVNSIAGASFTCGVAYYHTMKAMAAYLLRDDRVARHHSEEAEKILPAVSGQPMEATYTAIRALILARAYADVREEERQEIQRSLTDLERKLAAWCESCPENFAAKHALVEGALAEIHGEELAAARFYEQAAESARAHGQSPWQAMAHEAAGLLCESVGLATASRAHLHAARTGYSQWGAVAKVRLLEASHPWLGEESPAGPGRAVTPAEQMDVMSIVKAQHAISGEIVQEQLAETLLRIVMENAGAQHGYLSVEPSSELFAVAHANGKIEVERAPLAQFASRSESILNYVRRTGKPVILHDARRDAGDFADDEHLRETQPKSVLCLPILRQAKLLGAVYLENNLSAGAFSPEHLHVLEMLAAQAAISLETAGLYDTVHRNEQRYRLVFESSPVSIWEEDFSQVRELFDELRQAGISDLEDYLDHHPEWLRKCAERVRVLDVNRAALDLHGAPTKEALFAGLASTFTEKSYDTFRREIVELWNGGDRMSCDAEVKTLAGERRSVSVHFSVCPGYEQTLARVIVSLVDITARERAEESARKLSEAVEQSPVSIVIADEAGRVEFVNAKFEKVSGYSSSEVIGRETRSFAIGEVENEEYAPIWERIRSGKVWRGELLSRKKNGDLFWEYATIAPIRSAKGATTHYVAVKEDITQRKELEEQLRQTQKMEAVGQLAGGVAHDFNNMLGVILGHVELALRRIEPDDPSRGGLEQIQTAAHRSAEVTRQLLTFARKQTIKPTVLDLNQTIERALKLLRRLIGEEVALVWRPEERVWPILVDPTQIDQILANLCINAKDAIAGVGTITIATRNCDLEGVLVGDNWEIPAGRYVRLQVRDNGCGIDSETRRRIFEPFFTTKKPGKGTGLGLSTVYGIARQNEGYVAVESEVGRGSSFEIYLPRYVARRPSTEEAEQPLPDLERGAEVILLVEDDDLVLNTVQLMLERFGYRVLAASSPGKAMTLAAENRDSIDLLLTDVVMPEMTGRDLQRKIAAQCPGLKCLFMSGYTGSAIAHRGVLEEEINFLAKPFSQQELGAKIREVLDGR